MKLTFIMFACLLAGTLTFANAQDTSQQPAPDNTKVNTRDRNRAEQTADQQKENNSDRDMSKQIRQSIVKAKSLSTYAHNVKIVAQNGTVTLKGPVKSDEEKSAVEAKATAVAGEGKVINQLQVKPEKQ